MNHHDLMEIEADTAFTYDARGRIVLSNEPRASGRRPGQRCFRWRTRDGRVTRFGAALPDDAVTLWTEIVAREPLGRDLRLPPATAPEIEAALAGHAPVESGG